MRIIAENLLIEMRMILYLFQYVHIDVLFPNNKIHFININESSTYVEFLTTLNQICFNYIDYMSEDAFNRFQFIPISYVCAYFIQYKSGISSNARLYKKVG